MKNVKLTHGDIRFTARVRAWSDRRLLTERVMVDSDGETVRVYDGVAGHYTTCHALDEDTQARLRRQAAKIDRDMGTGRWQQAKR